MTSNGIRRNGKGPKKGPRESVGFPANRPNNGNHVATPPPHPPIKTTQEKCSKKGGNMRDAIINEQRATQFAYCPRSQSNHMNRKLKRKSLVCKYNAKYGLSRTEAYSR